MSDFGSTASTISRKTVKGLILITWISIMIYIAFIAATGNIINYFENLLEKREISLGTTSVPQHYMLAYDLYELYIVEKVDQEFSDIPLDNLLDDIFKEKRWNTFDDQINRSFRFTANSDTIILLSKGLIQSDSIFRLFREEVYEFNRWRRDQYFDLFHKAENLLMTPVFTGKQDVSQVTITQSFFPVGFMMIDNEEFTNGQNVFLSDYIRHWIGSKIERRQFLDRRVELVNTFFLLIALGSFGSLIFLTRDFITQESSTSVEAYIFRPFLGMFLAVGMFIIDLLAHVVISMSSVLDLRPEPLYLLALASGLLSEQAYEIMSIRAKRILERVKEEEENK